MKNMDYDHLMSVPSSEWNGFADTHGFKRPFEAGAEDDGFVTKYESSLGWL